MPHCFYELTFKAARLESPETFVDHPLVYSIRTSEGCGSLLISLDHPLKDKYGYARQTHAAQLYGVLIVAPISHIVRGTRTYFLVRLDSACSWHPKEPVKRRGEHSPPPTR